MRYDQKMSKYSRVAEQNSLRLIPVVFSHIGLIHGEFKRLVKEQIKQKMIFFEGEVKESKVRSTLKWWINSISIAISRTASRNVAFLVAMMRDFIMEGQHKFIMRRTESNGLELKAENKEALEDLPYNADLFITN